MFGKSKRIAEKFNNGEQLSSNEVLDVTLTDHGVSCTVMVSEEEFYQWLKQQYTIDATQTDYGVICEARIG